MSDHAIARRMSADLRGKRGDIAAALAGAADPDQFVQQAIAVVVGDDSLRECTRESVLLAILQCAAMGAAPSTRQTPQIQRRVALIARRDRKRGVVECVAQPEARWYQELFGQRADIRHAQAYLVLTGDQISYDPEEERAYHIPADIFAAATQETLRGGFVRLRYIDGHVRDLLVPRERFDRAMHASEAHRAGKSGPWATDYHQMALKTCWANVGRRHGATLFPALSSSGSRLAAAVQAQNYAEGALVERRPAQISAGEGRRRLAAEDAEQRQTRADQRAAAVERVRQEMAPEAAPEPDAPQDPPAWAIDRYCQSQGRAPAELTPDDIDRVWHIADTDGGDSV